MGCTESTASGPMELLLPATSSKGKGTVVIVGASIAGMTLGELLWDEYDVTFVDQRDHFEYWPGNLKQAVDGSIKDQIIVPFADFAKGYAGKFQFLQGRLLNVQKDTNLIELESNGKRGTLHFDVLVICTGFTYNSPIKSDGVYTVAGRKNNLAAFTKQIDEAKNIAIVGAGIVAVELTGEIAYHSKASEKKINLVVRGEKLLGQLDPKAGEIAEEQLKKNNVQIHYKTPYTENLKKEKGFDLVLECTGQKYNSNFLAKSFSGAQAKNGQIFVNDFFQVIGSDSKTNGKAKAIQSNIFAFGDCCRTSLNEVKNIPSLRFFGPTLYANVVSVLKKEEPKVSIPTKFPVLAGVSIGPSFGLFIMNNTVNSGDEVGKVKFQYISDYSTVWKGSIDAFRGQRDWLNGTYNDLAK